MAMFIVKPWYRKKDDAIYGAEWAGTSDPSWTRTDAAVGFADPNPYYAGMSSSPSSPFDSILPWSGMRRVSNAEAGELVEIPKFYYKLSQPNGVGLKVQISMSQFDGSSVDPMHMDRGDGVGEREYAYIGRYHCGSNGYKSTSGQSPYTYATRATMSTNIHNLGSNVWQYGFAERFTLWLLYVVEFAHWNSQLCIGYGCSPSSSKMNNGYTDSMLYHTGTDRTSRTTYGGTQYRYIEGLWDSVYDWLDGLYYNNDGMNVIKNPQNYADLTGGVLVGVPTGYTLTVVNAANIFPLFFMGDIGYNPSMYWCDRVMYNGSYPIPYCGGDHSKTQNYGFFHIGLGNVSDAYPNVGSRLMVLPPSRLAA